MIRNRINQNFKTIKNKNIALLFSGGVDSQTILYSCLDEDIKPVLYTFYVNDYISEDCKYAEMISNKYDLKLIKINIKITKEILIKDIEYLVKRFNMTLKTQIQCTHPFMYVIPEIKEDIVLSGICADELYGTPRSMSKHWRDDLKFKELREIKHLDEKGSSYKFIKDMVLDSGKTFIAPYKEDEHISNYLLNKTYKEIHSPKQKQVVLNEYPEILENKFYRRNSNLQCNSKLREYHSKLLGVSDKSIIKEYNKTIKNK